MIGAPLFEATSSSINLPAARWRAERGETRMEPGPYRTGDMVYEANFGQIDIDWESRMVEIQLRGEEGQTFQKAKFAFPQ